MRFVGPAPPEHWPAASLIEFDTELPAERPLVAVSGGGDSLALLLLLAAARPGRFAAATVDHGLRPEAAAEAATVAALCAQHGIAHTVLHPAHPIDGDAGELAPGTVLGVIGGEVGSVVLPWASRGSLQARARVARYDALVAHARAIGCDLLLTAHHRDDQAETFLMRASRGSGVDGLAGVRRRTEWDGFPVFRPVLRWSRDRLAGVVRASGVTPVDDPSNVDPAYDRTRFRRLLVDASELSVEGLVRSAGALADASEALGWTADIIARQRLTREGADAILSVAGLPREFRRRLLARALDDMGARAARGPSLDAAIDGVEKGGRVSLSGLLLELRADGRWRIYPAPPRRTG